MGLGAGPRLLRPCGQLLVVSLTKLLNDASLENVELALHLVPSAAEG